MANLEPVKLKWLEQFTKAAGKRATWKRTEDFKQARLLKAHGQIDAMADEMRIFATYEIDVKAFLFDKKIKSLKPFKPNNGKWDPNSEVDTGRDAKRMKEAVPEEVLFRLNEAQARILKLQDSLLESVKSEDWPKIRSKFEQHVNDELQKTPPTDLKKARQEAAEKLAVEFGCDAGEILKIELQGKIPKGAEDGKKWDEIKAKMKEVTQAADLEAKALKKLEKKAALSTDKPAKIQNDLQEQLKAQQIKTTTAQNAVNTRRTELAKKFGIESEEYRIDEIVGWEPMFSDLELRCELWKPLMRSGTTADNTIPDAFNETVQQFRGANVLYQERIELDTGDENELANNLENAKNVLGKAAEMADALVSAAGGPEIVGTIIDATNAIGGALLGGAKSVVERDVEGVFDAVGDILGSALSMALGPDQKGLSDLISGSYAAGCKGGKAIAKLVENPKENWKEALLTIAEGIADSFDLVGGSDKSLSAFSDVGDAISKAILAADLGSAIYDALTSHPPNPDAVVDAISNVCQNAISTGLGQTDLSSDDDDAITEGVGGMFDALKDNPKLMDALAKKFEDKGKEANDKQIENEMEDFQAQLAMGFGAGSDDPAAMQTAQDFNSLDRMINQINADRALIKMAEAIFDTGVKTAAEFFEPLKMATSGKDMIKNMILAVRRAIELKEWIELKSDALNAASVQGFAFANRVKNLKIQVSKRTLDAVLELAQFVGAATSCSGIASAAGVGVSKGAKAIQVLAGLIYEYSEKAELRRQWKKYKRCLENPYDRAAMRDCVQGNPTLSKYAMAYAAVEEKDAIAMEGMRACGISEATLRNPASNAMKVVTFLETKFNDDPQLVRRLKKQSWQAANIELAPSSWMTNKTAAVTKLKLSPVGTGPIDLALLKAEKAKQEFTDELANLGDAQEKFDTDLETFSTLQEPYVKSLREYNGAVTTYGNAQKKATDRFDAYDSTAPDKRDHKLVVGVLAAVPQAIERGNVIEARAKKMRADSRPFEKAVSPFGIAVETYTKAATNPVSFASYKSVLESVAAELKRYKPMKEGAKPNSPLEPCEEMQTYLDGLLAKTELATTEVEMEEKKLKTALDAAIVLADEAKQHEQDLVGGAREKSRKLVKATVKEVADFEQRNKEIETDNKSLIAAKKQVESLADCPAKILQSPDDKRAGLKAKYDEVKKLFAKGDYDDCVKLATELKKELPKSPAQKRAPKLGKPVTTGKK